MTTGVPTLLGIPFDAYSSYLSHAPRKVEAVGLVGLVIALSFATVCDSNLPFVAGIIVLGLIQIASAATYRKPRHARLEPN